MKEQVDSQSGIGGSYIKSPDGTRTLVQATDHADQAEDARREIEQKTAESQAALTPVASKAAPENPGKGGKNPKDTE